MIQIVIPMAGRGARFAGTETTPKPFIEVVPGRRMIEYVIAYLTLPEPHRFVFVCLAEHAARFDLAGLFGAHSQHFDIVLADTVTRGPAASALLAEPLIGDGELLVAYSDNFLDIDMAAYLARNRTEQADGAVITYPSTGCMESYVELDGGGRVIRAAEKEVISPNATAGLYYFRQGSVFVSATRRMMSRDAGDGKEFFVCPVYNELIRDGKAVIAHPIERRQKIEMGTPEDLAEARVHLAEAMRR